MSLNQNDSQENKSDENNINKSIEEDINKSIKEDINLQIEKSLTRDVNAEKSNSNVENSNLENLSLKLSDAEDEKQQNKSPEAALKETHNDGLTIRFSDTDDIFTIHDSKLEAEIIKNSSYGFGPFRPSWIQHFNKGGWFLIFASLVNFLGGSLNNGSVKVSF